jgi:cardiolipin synthase
MSVYAGTGRTGSREIAAGLELCVSLEGLTSGNLPGLLQDGREAFPRMLEAIRSARTFVLVEMYSFAADRVGRRFARALAERAASGVDVRLLYDSVGCRGTAREFFGWMRSRGVRVLEYHPMDRLLHGLRLRRRNHRKVLVVDGRVAFLGGLNLAREYASLEEGGGGWRDTVIEIEGPAAEALARSSLRVRERVCRDPEPALEIRSGPARPGGLPVLLARSGSERGKNEIGGHYLYALRRARRRIWIANPYLLPSRRFHKELRRAARRGVDVRLLLPGQSDVPPALWASQSQYARYLRWGVRLFEWKGPMMHAKTGVIDGVWSTVGSCNIDPGSLRHNLEVVAIVPGREFGERMEAMFESDVARSREILPEEWSRRGWARRQRDAFCHLFRFLL